MFKKQPEIFHVLREIVDLRHVLYNLDFLDGDGASVLGRLDWASNARSLQSWPLAAVEVASYTCEILTRA